MTTPKQLTEETPESPQDLDSRNLILAGSGDIRTDSEQKILTEELPQEEDESPSARIQSLES